jgi:hypothetical protein
MLTSFIKAAKIKMIPIIVRRVIIVDILFAALNCLRYYDCKIAAKFHSQQIFGIFCTLL